MNDNTPQWLKRVWAEADELPPWLKQVVGHPSFAQLHRQYEGEGDEATWWIVAELHQEGAHHEFVAGTLREACQKFADHYGL